MHCNSALRVHMSDLSPPRAEPNRHSPIPPPFGGCGAASKLREVAFQRDTEGSEPLRPEPVERLTEHHELRRSHDARQVATGTLACPSCDAPVAAGPGPMALRDDLECGFCSHHGRVCDYLSLGRPTRPTRVVVRIKA